MRAFKKYLLILGTVLFVAVLCRAWLFNAMVRYSHVSQRGVVALNDARVIAQLSAHQPSSIEAVIELTRAETKRRLKFSSKASSNDPNAVLATGRANCVGYAAVFSSIGNYLIQSEGFEHTYRINHLVGQLRFLGVDLHRLTDDPFFQDHDYVEIENLLTGERIYIDPSVSDYLGIDEVRSKK